MRKRGDRSTRSTQGIFVIRGSVSGAVEPPQLCTGCGEAVRSSLSNRAYKLIACPPYSKPFIYTCKVHRRSRSHDSVHIRIHRRGTRVKGTHPTQFALVLLTKRVFRGPRGKRRTACRCKAVSSSKSARAEESLKDRMDTGPSAVPSFGSSSETCAYNGRVIAIPLENFRDR